MNIYSLIFGYLGAAGAEYFLVRSSLVKGSEMAKFMVRQSAFWRAILFVVFPLAAIFAGVMSNELTAPILPLNFTTPTGTQSLQAIGYGGVLAGFLSGLRFKDVSELGVNDLSGVEKGLGVRDVLSWYLSR